jgi:hypothetical protein
VLDVINPALNETRLNSEPIIVPNSVAHWFVKHRYS